MRQFVKRGRVVDRHAGLMPTDQLVAWTRQALDAA